MPRVASYFVFAIVLVASPALVPATVCSQDYDREDMLAELSRLERICDSVELNAEAQVLRTWLPTPRRDQRVLYLPTESAAEKIAASADGVSTRDASNRSSWAKHFDAARSKYAAYLFKQAGQLADRGDEADAFRTLWQVLREDSNHAEARRILGTLATAASVRPRLRKGTEAHANFGWPAGSYSRIETPHFLLTTRAEAKASVELAKRMEEFYALWQQLFYPFWAKAGIVTARLSGRNAAWEKPVKMNVYLLNDRADYLQVLGVAEANVEVSVGYYASQVKKSFFYPDEHLEATLFHELTHQMFAEATSFDTIRNAGQDGGMWLLEGIALYMESLTQRQDYWTVGGFESPRLQTARFRALRDGYWAEWENFTQAGNEAWKQAPDISLRYTQAAGLTHLFMDQLEQPIASDQLFKSLAAIYQNAADAHELLALLGDDESAAKTRYRQALTLTDQDVEILHASGYRLQSLVLAGSNLTTASWSSLAEQLQLKWLDVSFSNAKSADLAWVEFVPSLERLSVEGSAVDGELLKKIVGLRKLVELDLSDCAIDDAALAQLAGHKSLETLWLTKTHVTDAALDTLAKLPNLKFCDIEATRISPARWQAFRRSHPRLTQE